MSDQIETAPPQTQTNYGEIEAEVIGRFADGPPSVVLQFEGLREPAQLWAELGEIGWVIPPMPPRPANAIDWTPDPVAGTDYTVLPWTVKEFKLLEETWNVPAGSVMSLTLDILLSHGVKVNSSSTSVLEYMDLYASQGKSGAGYRTVILLGHPVQTDPLPGAGTWVGISGRKKITCEWTELTLPEGEAIPGFETLESYSGSDPQAWFVNTQEPLAETAPAGKRMVRFVVPDLNENDAKIRRLNKILGDDVTSYQLQTLGGNGNSSAVLVNAMVAGNAFDMLRSNLCLRMPTAVVRDQA